MPAAPGERCGRGWQLRWRWSSRQRRTMSMSVCPAFAKSSLSPILCVVSEEPGARIRRLQALTSGDVSQSPALHRLSSETRRQHALSPKTPGGKDKPRLERLQLHVRRSNYQQPRAYLLPSRPDCRNSVPNQAPSLATMCKKATCDSCGQSLPLTHHSRSLSNAARRRQAILVGMRQCITPANCLGDER